MFTLAYVFTQFVRVFISVLQFLMMVRAIMSWLPFDEDSPLINFVMLITEPVVVPFRLILNRIDAVNELPIDISFFLAFISLGVIQMLLPGLV